MSDSTSHDSHVDGFIYGFSHFTQRRDSTSKRGYQQRSLVILSQHPYPALFYTLLAYLGQAFLSHGGPMLESACHNIAHWSDPLPGSTVELGFLGYVFTVELPTTVDAQQSSATNRAIANPEAHILVSLSPQDPPVLCAFAACLTHLWSIWECLLLCEPILVFGPSASMTSQVVWWLRDLIRPIPLAGDYRPFFTIHDAEHSVLVNPRPPQAGLLLGVTNPYFQRACQHWPHVLSLGTPKGGTKSSQPSIDISVGPSPGWNTKTHKRYIGRDKDLLKRLEEASRGNDVAKMEASEALREHFSARTTAFLVPLQRYLNTLIPTPADRSAPPTPTPSSVNFHSPSGSLFSTGTQRTNVQPPLRMKPFNESAFFASLKRNGSPLPFKSNTKRKEFYERWLRTSAFGVWIAGQEEVVNKVLAQDVPQPTGKTSLLVPH
ncbi:hypothetical protein NM688_g8627 [Phlebia brevispora]|uniref:Uncharacterized protein n=1 Tax=Phlebia brevispora TaxID=194682 RepID=A0ACC1RQ81_9APHY|nr:hypothetical protein NM688_g8627 [Phlebia brevispora]